MLRIGLVLLVVGGVIVFFGIQEVQVSSGSTAEPQEVVLKDLEAGNVPDNPHLQIGEHVALYYGCVYEYKEKRGAVGGPGPSARVTTCYYPVISQDHPFLHELVQLAAQHGDLSQLAESDLPQVGQFTVLVKTSRFNTVGDIPEGMDRAENVKGLVINRIDSLGSEETKLLKESFPACDVDRVLILQEGRKPSSALAAFGMIGGGGLLSLLGLGLLGMMFVGSGSEA